jgi:hypothetical protein
MTEQRNPPASALFHRALITLIPALSLGYAAYGAGFVWYLTLPALAFGVVAVYYLKRGSDQAKAEGK